MTIVIFSNSSAIIRYAKKYNIHILPVTKANVYGLPILKWMLLEARLLFPSDLIVYINSDILINPFIFDVANHVASYFDDRDVRFDME